MKAKKLSVLLISGIMSLSCALAAGCGFNGDTHTRHTYEWKSDSTSHWQRCTECNQTTTSEAHTDTDNDGKCDECERVLAPVSSDVAVTGVTVSGADTVSIDGTITLTATVLPENATDKAVTWESLDTAKATVSANGVVTGVAAGEVTIKATAGGVSGTKVITVTALQSGDVAVTGVTISGDGTVKEGETITLTAAVLPENATDKAVTWESLDTAKATVSANGVVTGVAAGEVTIKATAGGVSTTKVITVVAEGEQIVAVDSVALNKFTGTVEVGSTIILTAIVLPSNATNKNVSWSSSDNTKATVENGVVTGVAAGSATITASAGGKSASCRVTVTAAPPVTVPVESVTISGSKSFILEVGDTETLTATVLPENATNKTVTWTSSSDAVTVVNGTIIAAKTGTATITATAGGKSDTCTVTVEPKTVAVESVTLDNTSLNMRVGEKTTLNATINPANATDKTIEWTTTDSGVVSVNNGLLTAEAVGSATITATVGGKNATCQIIVTEAQSGVNDNVTYAHAGNESAAFEWKDGNANSATVQYKLSTAASYSSVDAQLIRQKDAQTARVDVVGLKGGAEYDFKITDSSGSSYYFDDVSIAAYDRSGYAHFNYNKGVGAYNDDGTPKSGAVIVYVTEATKNTVKATVNGKERTGIVSILQNAGTNTPLIVRVIGTVGAATWNKLVENNDNALTPDKVLGRDGTKLTTKYGITVGTTGSKDIDQETLKTDGMNTLNYYPEAYKGAKCEELIGLNSKIKYDSSKKEFDSCWNDCVIQNVKNVTVEGIGEDARIFQWGMTFKNSDSIEVRNLTFEDYTEDACSFEGGDTSASSLSSFSHGNIWLHHNTFEEGMNYWDVCNEQDKHDGDGSTDFKGLKNITLSYNVYNGTHKTGLIGGSNTQTTASVTFHHNAYNNCKARLPLARQANMHMYNNYYNGTTSTDISLRAGAYALVENCYFESNNNCPVELQAEGEKLTEGENKGKVTSIKWYGAAKLIGCTVNQSKIKIGTVTKNDVEPNVTLTPQNHLYIGSDRTKSVTNCNIFGQNFDTDSTIFYYKNGKSDVSEMLTAAETKTIVPQVAGVMKRNSNITGGGTEGGEQGKSVPAYTVSASNVSGLPTDNAAVLEANKPLDSYGIMELLQGSSWKIYSNSYLQSGGSNEAENDLLTIDLSNYTGSVQLTVIARTTSSSNTGRYYVITGNDQSYYCQGHGTTTGIANSDQTDVFTLQCGYKYTLKAYGGLRFKSFAFAAAN